MRRGFKAFAAVLPGLLTDLAGLAGAGLCSYGAWLIYAPFGFITAGALLLTLAVMAAKSAAPAPSRGDRE